MHTQLRLILLLPALLLAGCEGSGFWRYQADTLTLPGANPNRPAGNSETYAKVRHLPAPEAPPALLTEAGDIWPGAPAPVPTLRDLQQQSSAELGSAGVSGAVPGGRLEPLPPLPSLPGFEVPQQLSPSPPPQPSFPGTIVPPAVPGGRPLHFGQPQPYQALPGSSGRESIVVPNGNGTSTVIGPNGQVSTIPTPK